MKEKQFQPLWPSAPHCSLVKGAIETNSVFVCIGGNPRTDWAKPGSLLCDPSGHILTGHDLDWPSLSKETWSEPRNPIFMETSIPGLFAAGDVRHNSTKRFATAVGEGATAVSMVHEFLRSAKRSPRGMNADATGSKACAVNHEGVATGCLR